MTAPKRRWEDPVEAGPYAASGIDMVALALEVVWGLVVFFGAVGAFVLAWWTWR